MDIEKLIKFVQNYTRDYIFSVLSILSAPGKRIPEEASADQVLVAADGKIYVFCFISIALGYCAFSAAITGNMTDIKIAYLPLLFTFWLWVIFSIVVYFTILLCDGVGTFVETLSVCLRVCPTVYVISSFAALTVGIFGKAWAEQSEVQALTYAIFLITQFVLLSVYLPAGLRRVHQITLLSQIGLSVSLPFIVLLVNLVGLQVIGRYGLQGLPVGSAVPPMGMPMMPPPMSN